MQASEKLWKCLWCRPFWSPSSTICYDFWCGWAVDAASTITAPYQNSNPPPSGCVVHAQCTQKFIVSFSHLPLISADCLQLLICSSLQPSAGFFYSVLSPFPSSSCVKWLLVLTNVLGERDARFWYRYKLTPLFMPLHFEYSHWQNKGGKPLV